jgi:methylglutamate dehydrogenase subunit D
VDETVLLPISGFSGLAHPGRYGRLGQWSQPVSLQERLDLRLVQIAARKGKQAEIAEAVRSIAGLRLPEGPKRVVDNGLAVLGTGPRQWLAVAETREAQQSLEDLIAALPGLAAIADLSSGKAVLRISGPAARDVLAKGCPLDLHRRAFGLGDAARTAIALIPCQLWQVDVRPGYDIAVDLSYTASFWGWITAAAAEYGYEVAAASD